MKTNKWMTRLLSGALVALGFTACDDENNGDYPDDYPLEYGSPSVEYRVKGTVTDEAGNPIENIRVIIRNAWDNTPNPYMDDTVYTDKQGAFANTLPEVSASRKFTSMTSTEKPTEALSNRTARILPIWKARK